jgi:hypothetical protein
MPSSRRTQTAAARRRLAGLPADADTAPAPDPPPPPSVYVTQGARSEARGSRPMTAAEQFRAVLQDARGRPRWRSYSA